LSQTGVVPLLEEELELEAELELPPLLLVLDPLLLVLDPLLLVLELLLVVEPPAPVPPSW